MSGARSDVIVYGVQIADVTCPPGLLSPPVESAAARVVELIAEEVSALLAST